MRLSLLIAFPLLLLSSCGSDRGEVANAVTKPNKPNDMLSMDSLQSALAVHLDRARQRIGNTSQRIQVDAPDNRVRRVCLMWQIRTNETLMGAAHQKNLVVALVQTWYWAAAMERFFTIGRGKDFFAAQQQEVIDAVVDIHSSTEVLTARYLPAKQVAALKADILAAVGNGDLFAATMSERNQTMDKILSATRIESVLGVALSPFEIFGSVNKGADAMQDLNKTSNRAIDLAERYPEMIGWYLQLAALEIQEQEGFSRALSDVHSVSQSVKDLPTKLRQEAQTLMAESAPLQADTRTTLTSVQQAGVSVEHAATAIENSIRSLDTFVTNAKGPPAKPSDPPAEPFRIQDYAAAFQAAESASRQITAALDSLTRAIQSPETRTQVEALMRDADGRIEKARQESERLMASAKAQADQLLDKARIDSQALIDHTAWRLAQLAGWIAALVIVVMGAVRFLRRTHA